jgi:hypothetical protein
MTLFEKHADMVSKLAKDGQAIIDKLTPEVSHLQHMSIGIAGESTELLSAIAAATYTDADVDEENVLEELGDMEFFEEGIRAPLGISYEACLARAKITNPAGCILEAAILLAVYGGRVLDAVKQSGIYGKPLNPESILQELAQLLYHKAEFYAFAKFTREQALEHNMAKLAVRYANFVYSDKAAIDRADKVEIPDIKDEGMHSDDRPLDVINDADFDEPLPERPATVCDGETCESCQ